MHFSSNDGKMRGNTGRSAETRGFVGRMIEQITPRGLSLERPEVCPLNAPGALAEGFHSSELMPSLNSDESDGFAKNASGSVPNASGSVPERLSLNAPGGWLAIGFGRFTCAAEELIFASRTRPAADGPGRGPGGSPPRAGRGCRRAGSAPARGKAGPAALRGSPPGRI